MMDKLLETLQRAFTLREASLGEDACQRVGPMTFKLRRFQVEGIGNLSLMSGTAMLGLMRMETLILTPISRDAPLLSYDRIVAMGKDTLIAEWYDTCLTRPDEASLSALREPLSLLATVPEYDLGAHWYDPLKLSPSCSRRGRGCADVYRAYLDGAMQAYCRLLQSAPVVEEAAKKRKTAAYVNGLFEHGGPSTDAFVKALGREKAMALFENVIFGLKGC